MQYCTAAVQYCSIRQASIRQASDGSRQAGDKVRISFSKRAPRNSKPGVWNHDDIHTYSIGGKGDFGMMDGYEKSCEATRRMCLVGLFVCVVFVVFKIIDGIDLMR